jgi:formamidopyrimidine-DNA glycosylase
MPELPEVEAVVRKLRKQATGGVIAEVHVQRPRSVSPQKPGALVKSEGGKILGAERRGKNILLPLSNGYTLRSHLGMTGNLYVIPDARLHPERARVYFTLTDGRGLIFDDSRVFGRVHIYRDDEVEGKLEHIGVDPFSKQFTPELLQEMASRSKKPAKVFLMDQTHVSGIGNMYAAESLFRAKIDPRKPVNKVPKAKVIALHAAIVAVLKEAVQVAVKAYSKPGDYKEMDFNVYGRAGEPCRVCGRKIKKIEQAGRSTYYCPFCQR